MKNNLEGAEGLKEEKELMNFSLQKGGGGGSLEGGREALNRIFRVTNKDCCRDHILKHKLYSYLSFVSHIRRILLCSIPEKEDKSNICFLVGWKGALGFRNTVNSFKADTPSKEDIRGWFTCLSVTLHKADSQSWS